MEQLMSTLDSLRGTGTEATVFKMFCAVLFGGLIGLERERKHRPAGFRTYMLVCLGAALTMMLGEYCSELIMGRWAHTASQVGAGVDVSRFGAQVINGIGFLGAGTILLTSHQEIKGTTTAAGLWASGCLGLAIGVGFYECMLLGFILIIVCFKFFPIIEENVVNKSKNMNIYTEIESISAVNGIIDTLSALGIRIYDIELERREERGSLYPSAVFTLLLPKKMHHAQVLTELSGVAEIVSIDEI